MTLMNEQQIIQDDQSSNDIAIQDMTEDSFEAISDQINLSRSLTALISKILTMDINTAKLLMPGDKSRKLSFNTFDNTINKKINNLKKEDNNFMQLLSKNLSGTIRNLIDNSAINEELQKTHLSTEEVSNGVIIMSVYCLILLCAHCIMHNYNGEPLDSVYFTKYIHDILYNNNLNKVLQNARDTWLKNVAKQSEDIEGLNSYTYEQAADAIISILSSEIDKQEMGSELCLEPACLNLYSSYAKLVKDYSQAKYSPGKVMMSMSTKDNYSSNYRPYPVVIEKYRFTGPNDNMPSYIRY